MASPPDDTKTVGPTLVLCAYLGGWFTAVLLLCIGDRFRGNLPLYLAFVFAPGLALLALVVTWRSLRQTIRRLDTSLLVSLHAWRAAGLAFIAMGMAGSIPGAFAHVAGWGDVIAGMVAPFVARARTRWLVAWSIFGVVDFVVAVSLNLATRDEAWWMARYPLAVIPTFFVPVFFLIHLECLARART
jgi:hypothetical protein